MLAALLAFHPLVQFLKLPFYTSIQPFCRECNIFSDVQMDVTTG